MSQSNYSEGHTGDILSGFNERVGGPLFDKYRQLALDNQIWLSLGSFPEGSSTVDGKTY